MVALTTAGQAAQRDAAAIAAGVPQQALMQRAGALAAAEIALRFPRRLKSGALVLAGPGNNGGDARIVAAALAATGVRVRINEPWDGERLVVDGLLGTGAHGAPRGVIAERMEVARHARERGAAIVSLDLPSGLDATSGDAAHALRAQLTLAFGTLKRGQLVARDHCGRIVVLDIGLGSHGDPGADAPGVVDERWVASRIPRVAADAHKGTRRKVIIVGGASGMTGAAILAARAALQSGVGMVKLAVDQASLAVVQRAEPLALASVWPASAKDASAAAGWCDAIAIGPGLGASAVSRELVERLLEGGAMPVVLDADALNVFAGDLDALRMLLKGRAAVITPHPLEAARLLGVGVDDVLARRFEIGEELAARAGAVVVLKGVPTVITHPDGRCVVSPRGTPLLAAAGSGDVLTGVAVTLLAQMDDAFEAAACAAWVHGRAAEVAARRHPGRSEGSAVSLRGLTLSDVLDALPAAWQLSDALTRSPVLLELPPVS
ncbi:MAG: NAD(P)H-hydrate epimerase [Gemmatimonadetes bacterium]|nr:NAD(P)H-hydrate epimerase [Gemmatimonadota bacterium]